MKNKIILYIISISFILSSLLGTIHFCCFDESFYTRQHNEILLYGKHINEHIGISNDDLKELTSFTLEYLNDKDASLDKQMNINGTMREVFTDDEKAHMVDVRALNLNATKLLIFSAVTFAVSLLIYLIKYRDVSKLNIIYKKTFASFLMFFIVIGVWVLLDFDSFWTLFHKIFFSGNDLWLLDLRKDILIMIVPPEFFNNLVTRIIIFFIIIILGFGLVLKYLSRKKIENG